jgi:hypothetical protein
MVISFCFVLKVAEYGDQFVFVGNLSARWQNMVVRLCFVGKLAEYGAQFVCFRKVAEYGDQFVFCL